MAYTRALLILWISYLVSGMFIDLRPSSSTEPDSASPHAVVFATNQDLFESPFWAKIQSGNAREIAASSVIYIVETKSVYHFDESETDPDFEPKSTLFNKPWLKKFLKRPKRNTLLVEVQYGPQCQRSVRNVPTSYCALSRLSLGGGLYAQDYSWAQLLTLKVGTHKTIGANIGLIGLGATVAAGNDDISLLMGNSGGITCTILPGQRVQVFSSFRYVHFPWAKLRQVMFSKDDRELVPQSDWKQISSRLALDSRMVQSRVRQSRPFEKRSEQDSALEHEDQVVAESPNSSFRISLQSLMKPELSSRLQSMDGCEDSIFGQQTIDGISSMLHLKLRSIGAVFFDMSTMPEYYCVDSEEDLRCDQDGTAPSISEPDENDEIVEGDLTDSEDNEQTSLYKRGRDRPSPGRSSRGRSSPYDGSYDRDNDLGYEGLRRGGLRGRSSLDFDYDEQDDDYDDCALYDDRSRDRQEETERYKQRRRQRHRALLEKQREQERLKKELECEQERQRLEEERECEEKRREQERLREERECEEKRKAREREERQLQLQVEMEMQERECERERQRLEREQVLLDRQRAREERRRQRGSDRDRNYGRGDEEYDDADMDFEDDDCTMSDGSMDSDDEDEYTVDYGSKGKPTLRGKKSNRKGSAKPVDGLRESARKTFRALLFQGD